MSWTLPEDGDHAGAPREGAAALQRHQLVHLNDATWAQLLAEAEGGAPRAGLAHWAACDGPLVVVQQQAQQQAQQPLATLALGLPLPARWGLQRWRLQVPVGGVSRVAAFPLASEVLHLLPPAARPDIGCLCRDLAAMGVEARAYGSYGWQRLTGLGYVHKASDLDLLLAVHRADGADQAVACLAALEHRAPRLDGELLFDDGTAVAWREWQPWRSGGATQILLKRTAGPSLADSGAWLVRATASTAAPISGAGHPRHQLAP